MRCSRAGSWLTGTRSDRPVPRLSKVIRRANDASRRRNVDSCGSSHCRSMFDTQPWTKTRSNGPSPTTW